MRKITFWLWASCCFAFLWQSHAQTLNENADWPNAAWTVTGDYNSIPTAFEADPRVTPNFAFDDDDAGSGHEDNIAAESPVIDLTAAHAAGEIWLYVTADYGYRLLNTTELLRFEYWDADASAWAAWGEKIPANYTATTINDNFCTIPKTNITTSLLDIAGFTATQLSGFRYRIYFDDNVNGIGWVWGFCFDSPTIYSATPPTDILDYYNLQWPAAGTIEAGQEYNVYAQAYEAGLTDEVSGQAPGIEAWIGYSTADTDPSGADWIWVDAAFNVEAGNNDEYMLNLGSQISTAGTYYYASRWRLNGGFYTYGGIQADGSYGGAWGEDNNGSGVLTVTGPANDDCSGAISLTVNDDYNCAVVTPGTTQGATASGVDEAACSGTENDDVWFSFVATSVTHRISLTNVTGSTTDLYHSLWTGSDCGSLALVPGTCSDPNTSNPTGLEIGETYYVRVNSWAATAHSVNFNICIGTPPTCYVPTGLNADSALDTAQVSWTAPTLGNVPESYNWEVQPQGVSQGTPGAIDSGSTSGTSDTVNGLTPETVYDLYVQSNCGGGDLSAWAGPYSFSTLWPDPACGGYFYDSGGSAGNYSTSESTTTTIHPDVAGQAVTITFTYVDIETATGAGTQAGCWDYLTIYDGPDTSSPVLAQTLCGEESGDGGVPSVASSELNIGDSFTSTHETGALTIVFTSDSSVVESGWVAEVSCATMSIGDVNENNFFTYYPNPVKNTLTLNAQNLIKNVAVYNMLGQEVLRVLPNAVSSVVDMASLQTGTYFVKVTVNDTTETIRIIKR